LLTDSVYKLPQNHRQELKMSGWLDMRSHSNWFFNDKIRQDSQHCVQGKYCKINPKIEAFPLTTCVSKNGATGNQWTNPKVDKEGKVKNPRRSAGDIKITALPE
jgi:putative transposase